MNNLFLGDVEVRQIPGDEWAFNVILTETLAWKLALGGWYVQELSEGNQKQPYLKVHINRSTSIDLTLRPIMRADVTIHPYEWHIGDKHGVKAYLHSIGPVGAEV